MSSSYDNAKHHVRFLDRFASVVLILASVAVLLAERRFVKLKIGPIFALEWVFLIVLASWSFQGDALKRAISFAKKQGPNLLFPILFFAWGFLRLGVDFAGADFHLGAVLSARTLQHSLIFIYPLIWIFCGYGVELKNSRWGNEIVVGVLVAQAIPVIPKIQRALFWNVSVGPIFVVPAFLAVVYFFKTKPAQKNLLVFGVLCFCLSFYSFWGGWGADSLSRTSFLSLSLLLTLPVLFSIGNFNFWPTLKTAVTAGLVFFAGIAVNTLWTTQSKEIDFKGQFVKSFQHADDVSHKYLDPHEDETQMLHFRTRKFLWTTAISDWSEKPIFGIGWLPEFPSHIYPDVINDHGYETSKPSDPMTPPVNGAHNSYLTILARVGIAGALIFLALILILARDSTSLLKRTETLQAGRTIREWLSANVDVLVNYTLVATVISGGVYALFNVCLESPQYCMITWLFAGIITARTRKVGTKAKLH